MKILQIIYRLVQSDSYATKRLFILFQSYFQMKCLNRWSCFFALQVCMYTISLFIYLFICRDIYYNNTQLFGSQKTVDCIVDDISCMLKVPRRSLHVVSVSVVLRAVKTFSLNRLISTSPAGYIQGFNLWWLVLHGGGWHQDRLSLQFCGKFSKQLEASSC